MELQQCDSLPNKKNEPSHHMELQQYDSLPNKKNEIINDSA